MTIFDECVEKLTSNLNDNNQYHKKVKENIAKLFDGLKVTELRQFAIEFDTNFVSLYSNDKDSATELGKKILNFSSGNDLSSFSEQLTEDNIQIIKSTTNQLLKPINKSDKLLEIMVSEQLTAKLAAENKDVLSQTYYTKSEGNGRQFGCAMTLEYKRREAGDDTKKITFYIKSNSKYPIGSNLGSSGHGQDRTPDLREILAYKILEHIGYGPKTSFIFNPLALSGLFIATQAADHSKTHDSKSKTFKTASVIEEAIKQDASLRSEDMIPFIDRVTNYQDSSDEIDLTVLDILARTLRLTDLNFGNFGNVEVKSGTDGTVKSKWKLIDFDVSNDLAAEETIVESFVKGNSGVTLAQENTFTGTILKGQNQNRKIGIGNEAIKKLDQPQSSSGKKLSFENAIDKALEEIKTYVSDDLEREKSLGLVNEHNQLKQADKLEEYCQAVKGNYQSLKYGLSQSRTIK
jgi:hypothetical protein